MSCSSQSPKVSISPVDDERELVAAGLHRRRPAPRPSRSPAFVGRVGVAAATASAIAPADASSAGHVDARRAAAGTSPKYDSAE